MISVAQITQIFSFFTLLLDGALLTLVGYYLFCKVGKSTQQFFKNKLVILISKNARLIAFSLALASTLGSLFYSEFAGFEPCTLCWYQRIFMYPLVVLVGVSILANERTIAKYAMPMSAIGGLLAGYHYYIQRGGQSFVSCSAVGYSASCSDHFTMSFGYITIPMMALTVFVGIFLVMWLYKTRQKF